MGARPARGCWQGWRRAGWRTCETRGRRRRTGSWRTSGASTRASMHGGRGQGERERILCQHRPHHEAQGRSDRSLNLLTCARCSWSIVLGRVVPCAVNDAVLVEGDVEHGGWVGARERWRLADDLILDRQIQPKIPPPSRASIQFWPSPPSRTVPAIILRCSRPLSPLHCPLR